MHSLMSAPRRVRLRAATDSLHRRIDEKVGRAGFLKTIEGYRDYLLRTYAARAAVEAALDPNAAERLYPDWPERRIAEALECDLDDMGVKERPVIRPMRGALGEGGILGALYVLEGSTIGARWIAREVEKLGVVADNGGRHLSVQAANPRAFRLFIDILEAARLDADAEAECVAAAIDTFSCFQRAYAG